MNPPSASIPLSFHRPCWVELSASSLRRNWRFLRSQLAPDVQMLAVVKANGYGLGLEPVSRIAVQEGAAYLGVSSVEEGIHLRQLGLKTPVLILGSLFPFDSFSLLFEHRLTPTIASLEAAQALDRLASEKNQTISVHLKIDSGFGRIGVSLANAVHFIGQVAALKGLQIEGLYTHFASSDVDPGYTLEQANAFEKIVREAASLGIRPRYVHMANSAALLRFPQTHGSLVRPGIAFYGIPPYAEAVGKTPLAHVVTWKTRIIFLKTVPAGTSVSYARTWTAKRETRVATLAAGYADGLPRLLSNRGEVLVSGKRARILGRVTMDMTMVDVSEIPEARVGEETVLLGRQGSGEITALEMAAWAETNAYEILCGIGARVPKVLCDE